jgi:hypothetical protein
MAPEKMIENYFNLEHSKNNLHKTSHETPKSLLL